MLPDIKSLPIGTKFYNNHNTSAWEKTGIDELTCIIGDMYPAGHKSGLSVLVYEEYWWRVITFKTYYNLLKQS